MLKVDFYDPASPPGLRYVRKAVRGNHYEWATRSAINPRYYQATGTCSSDDLPANIREVCDITAGMNSVFYASEWP